MRLKHNIAPAACTALAALALTFAAAFPCTALADEEPLQTAAATGTPHAADASKVAMTTFCLNWAAEDPSLEGVAGQPSVGISVTLVNDVEGADALYDAIDDLRSGEGLPAATRDYSLEWCAYQRAAESSIAHSNARPDGSLFLSTNPRTAAEVLAWGTADDADVAAVMAALSQPEYAEAAGWVRGATNIGCALVHDGQGNALWAIELAFDNAPAEGEAVPDGEMTYWSGAVAANVHDATLPETIEMKSGDTLTAPILARVEGTAHFGLSDYPLEFTGVEVRVHPGSFIWNTANVKVVSTTADGQMTAHSAGTVTVSATDPDGANPRFTVAVVDGGAKPTVYNLAECSFVGIVGEDGLGNFYLNDEGTVNMPAFNIVTPDNTVVDPVNYTATVEYDEGSPTATLTVKAARSSTVCKGTATKELNVTSRPEAAKEVLEGLDVVATAEGEDGETGEEEVGEQAEEAETPEGAEQADPAAGEGQEPEAPEVPEDGQEPEAPEDGQEPAGDPQADEGGSDTAGSIDAAESIQGARATLTFASTVYTGRPIEPTSVEVVLNGTTLVEGRDYTVMLENNVDVGTARAVVSGAGGYTGYTEATFAVVPADISHASVTMPNLVYTGEQLAPRPVSVAVTTDGGTEVLSDGADYQVVGYADNVNVGDATAVLQGTGNYTGTVSAKWRVVPQGTADPGTTQTAPVADAGGWGIVPVLGVAVAGVCLVAAAVGVVIAVRRRASGGAHSTGRARY